MSANDFDLLIIPGGFAPDFLRRCEPVIKLTSTMAEQGKIVAAICHGPWVLCSTQALKGRKATCFFAIKDDVMNAGANYVDQEVVREGNLITSRRMETPSERLEPCILGSRGTPTMTTILVLLGKSRHPSGIAIKASRTERY
jgi:hypothetical protein